MVRRGHVPQRMCAGCRRRFAREALVRFTVDDAGGAKLVIIDYSGHGAGRGAYTCPRPDCFNRAAGGKGTALARRLGAEGIHPDLEREFARLLESRG